MKKNNQFITILKDICLTENGEYSIVTKIHNMTFKTEVFLNGSLIDVTEKEYTEQADHTVKEEYFSKKYNESHRHAKEKYCASVHVSRNNLAKKSPIFSRKSMLALLGGLALLLLANYLSRRYIYFKDEQPEQAYSTQNKKQNQKLINTGTNYEFNSYLEVLPKNKIRLYLHKPLELIFKNNSNKNIEISLVDKILNDNPHDEIVQFKNGIISGIVSANGEQVFEIYIEPTYYKQFSVGLYSGILTFKITYDNNNSIEISKPYSFQVK